MRLSKLYSFAAIMLLVAILFAGPMSVPAAAQADTMQFRYNAAHTGDYGQAASTQPNGQLRWKFTTGDHVESAAVANGIVYVESEKLPPNNTYTATSFSEVSIHAINAANGAAVWCATKGRTAGRTFGWSPSTPAIANGVVYIGGADGNVYALNATTGDTLWVYPTGGPVYSSPAVVNGVVYVGSYDHNVYALNATTGAKLWSYKTSGSISSSPAVDDGVVYINSNGPLISTRTWSEGGHLNIEQFYRGALYSLQADTGKENWNYTFGVTGGERSLSSPAVVNGIIYVGSGDNNVYAFNYGGEKLWNYTTAGQVLSSPAVANGTVYVGSEDWNFYAINSSTGAKLWSYVIGNSTNGCISSSSPAVVNGVVYITAGNGDLYALDAGTGNLKWLYETGSGPGCTIMDPSPAVADGIVYVGTYDGNVYAIGNSSGGGLIPGFEVAFAVVGLAVAAYVVSRRR
jgi:PGF-CTERM protein